jgi:site-specific DNA-adenine methylase
MTLLPVVGYQGGKRRLLKRLRPLLPVSMTHYVEPFVGMGAAYLDLRDRGYDGHAVLGDSNPQVRDFWLLVHGQGQRLIEAVGELEKWPRDAEGYYAMQREPIESRLGRVARFLWLTNYAFGNVPPAHNGTRWVNTSGTKLTSAAKWGKTFPWQDCVARLERVVARLDGCSAEVYLSAAAALGRCRADSVVYADPPYSKHEQYHGARNDFTQLVAQADGATVILSEASDVGLGDDWSVAGEDVVARLSHGTGANGKRRELLYVKCASEAVAA